MHGTKTHVTSPVHDSCQGTIRDAVHAVEITDDDCLVFWAPDGKSIVYGQLDQHGVSNFEYNVFLGSENVYRVVVQNVTGVFDLFDPKT